MRPQTTRTDTGRSGAADGLEDRAVSKIGAHSPPKHGERLDIGRDRVVGPPAERVGTRQLQEHQRHLPFGLPSNRAASSFFARPL